MEKENVNPGELLVNQNDMGVVNVQNYVKENQRNQNAEQVMTAVREDVEPIEREKVCRIRQDEKRVRSPRTLKIGINDYPIFHICGG